MTEKVKLPDEVWTMTEEEYLQYIVNGIADGRVTEDNIHCYCSRYFRDKHWAEINRAFAEELFKIGAKVIEEALKRRDEGLPF